jgi:hypothetical protein
MLTTNIKIESTKLEMYRKQSKSNDNKGKTKTQKKVGFKGLVF